MSLLVLYALLTKATLTSFSGLAPLPIVRHDLVLHYKVLTDRQLSTAVAAGSIGPGPLGLWIVSVGYFVAGLPGACAGTLALLTPAFLILPILRYLGSRADRPRVKSCTRAVTVAAAGLIVSVMTGLAKEAITSPLHLAIAVASLVVLAATRIDTLWVIGGAALAGFLQTLLAR